ncbi:chloride channel protein [Ignavigranum ruoffiae]
MQSGPTNTLESQPSLPILMVLGAIIGLVAGLTSIAYRFVISQFESYRHILYSQTSLFYLILYGLAILLIAYILLRLLQWAPFSNGSGIPQIKAEIMNHIDQAAWPTIISKFVGGSLNSLIGFSLGREGPSIQIGGMAGKWLSQVFKVPSLSRKFLISAGASAGLSAAFNAPLAGVLFTLEEMYGTLSTAIIVPSMVASLVANFVSFKLMGLEYSFSFAINQNLPLDWWYLLIILGLASGIVGVAFNTLLEQGRQLLAKSKLKPYTIIILTSFIVLALGYTLPEVLGGGHHWIEKMSTQHFSLAFLALILIVKMILTILCYNSGVQGGIFLPVLVLGATLGNIIAQSSLTAQDQDTYLINFIILAMAGVLASVVRAPLMSILLITEMTGSLNHFINIAIVAFIAMVTADLLNSQPVYHTLYSNLLRRIERDQLQIHDHQQIIISPIQISHSDRQASLLIKDLTLDCPFQIVKVIREEQSFIPNGSDVLLPGDLIYVAYAKSDAEKVISYFQS